MKVERKNFVSGEILSAHDEYVDCRFDRCSFIFSGTGPVFFDSCHFGKQVTWLFDGPAAATIRFLESIYAAGNRPFIEQLFDAIRSNRVSRTGMLH